MAIEYLQYRHDPPIIWLDTNIINEIVDALKGKTKDSERSGAILRIYELLIELVEKNKVICPFSGQRQEYGKTADSELADDVLMRISNGFQVSGWKVDIAQLERMVCLYCDDSRQFAFLDSDLKYKQDKEPDNEYGLKVVILLERPDRDRRQKSLENLLRRKEEVVRLGMTRKQIYDSEASARALNLNNQIKYLHSNSYSVESAVDNLHEEEAMFSALYPLYVFKKKLNRHTTPEEYIKFITSGYLEALPWDKINTTLITWLLTEVKNLEEQHISDVENLSKILPYASIVVTERQMAHALNSSGLAKQFGTEIFTLRTLNLLELRLSELLR